MLEPLCAPADVETARMISLAWLRHALEGSLYPLDPHLENLAYAPGYRFVFGAGGFATMPKPMQQRLKDYLIAMVSDDADEAAASLAAASGRQVPETVFEELRRQFRQMAPFRDGFRRRQTVHGGIIDPLADCFGVGPYGRDAVDRILPGAADDAKNRRTIVAGL
jgi:predicted unusual protein kinase regulating ubiquinone biosynthesis (AarF/ABC1/UbiB family)